jgi:diguanylate cyclase (GGDEF)-like protein
MRAVLLLLAYGGAYAGLYWVSRRFGTIASVGAASALWLPSGLQVAVLLLFRDRRWWPVVVAVGAISELLSGWWQLGPVTGGSLAVAGGNALEALLAAGVVRAAGGRATPDLHRIREVVVLGIAAVVAPAVNAAVTLPAYGFSTWGQRWDYFHVYWLGDAAAIVALVPVALTVLGPRHNRAAREPLPGPLESAALAVAALAVFLVVFGRGHAQTEDAGAVAFVWPVLAWAALRSGPALAAVLSAGFFLTADVATRAGRGPYGGFEQAGGARVSALQGLLIMLSLSSAALAAVLVERRQAESALEQLGETDPVTGVPTTAVARRTMELLRGSGSLTAVLVLDLDGFAAINSTYGHAVGDAVLRKVAARLSVPLRAGDVVARGTGDAFVVVIGRLASAESAELTAERVLATLATPVVTEHAVVPVSVCSGLAVLEEGEAVEDGLSRALAALAQAQSRGPGRSASLDVEAFGRLDEARRLQVQFQQALTAGELTVHYQPIVDVRDQCVVAVEALVRWPHPERGLLVAGVFMPDAEASGLVLAVDRWVATRALADLSWLRTRPGMRELMLFLNVSARTLAEPDSGEWVRGVLREHGVAPTAVVLEITETALVDDSEVGRRAAAELVEAGVSLAIDDFGQGHASLARLRALPISVVKIDQAFVSGLGTHEVDDAVVRWTTLLAQQLRMSTVAEGVESRAQLDRLAREGVDFVQGYWLAPPMPLDTLAAAVGGDGRLVTRDPVRAGGT